LHHRFFFQFSQIIANRKMRRFGQLLRKPTIISTKNVRQASTQGTEGSLLEADSSALLNKLYHKSGLVLAGLTPVALIFSTPFISFPVDLALGVIFPLHSHVALNYIVTDYLPKSIQPTARYGVLIASGIALAGILKLNFDGPGLTASLKALWKPRNK